MFAGQNVLIFWDPSKASFFTEYYEQSLDHYVVKKSYTQPWSVNIRTCVQTVGSNLGNQKKFENFLYFLSGEAVYMHVWFA